MKGKFRISAKPIVLLTAILLVVNVALGALLINGSRSVMKELINDHMLGIAETAAALLDGDELAALTEADEGGPTQREIVKTLRFFSDRLDFRFIYVVRPNGDDGFIFIADADPDEPAAFGEAVVLSPALLSARDGRATVDGAPVGDHWGKFYTAYSPVFTADGRVGGIVGVDFDAAWYENQMTRNTLSLLLLGAISVLIGGGIVLLVTNRLRRRFDKLSAETVSLAADLGTLMDEIRATSRHSDAIPAPSDAVDASGGADSVDTLTEKMQNIKNDLKLYIPLVHAQAYTDGLTGVGNKAAYLELVHELDEKIAEGTARFSLAVFDINGLKAVNDDYGHEEGDETIVGAAECIKAVFGKENVFRIGGDEFIAVLPDLSEEDMAKAFERLDREVESANAALADTDGGAPVSFSKGAVTFDPNVDREFKTVFKRADEAMYRNKGDYYRQFGDRRKKE